ncbi:site-2 protease family protein [Candidatus Woesearchaeota archaeon]|nr:site-2 protease family protein [Candidatus Woesearchaeota archaeon]
MSLASFLGTYKSVIIFYAAVILIIYANRRKFEIQAKIIALYRTSFGVKKIHSFANKNKELVKILGYIGIGIGFVGMVTISFVMLHALWELLINPSAPPAVQPVIPGVRIPGFDFFIPLWYGIIGLFTVVTIHEFSHGIVAAAHGLRIKNTGIVFFGPLIGAFVEPDEEQLKTKSDVVQYSIFAAGPFSNVLTAALVLLAVMFVLNPLSGAMSVSSGVYFTNILNDTPASVASLNNSVIITGFNDVEVLDSDSFMAELGRYRPNESITLITNQGDKFDLALSTNPDDSSRGYLGVSGIMTKVELKSDNFFFRFFYGFLKMLGEQFFWIYVLSLGIGLANLLPLGPVDGGRMLQTATRKVIGEDKKADFIWAKISYATLLILLVLIFSPILKKILGF